jgi:site-specific recombinase XerD
MFSELLDKGLISVNPVEGVKVPGKVIKKIPRILFTNELKIFFEELKNHTSLCQGYFAEMLLTYLYTGLRRIELVYLMTQNINFTDKLIIIRGKGSKERIVDILPPLMPVMQSVINKNDNRNGKYFFGAYNKPIIHEDTLSHKFKDFISNVKLPNSISLHSLRHTFISYALKVSGGDIKYVQQLAGHSDLKTTAQYIHLIPMKESPIAQLDYKKFFEIDKNENDNKK